MRIALLQWNTAWEDPRANFDHVRERLASVCRDQDPDFVSLPELFATGFTMNVDELAEEREGPTDAFLREMAAEHDIYLQGAAIHRADDRGENTALIYNPDGELVCRYVKVHPFSYEDEDRYYRPGDAVRTVDVHGFTICPVICYDLRFPELFREGVRQGADLFLVPANWPTPRLDHWRTLLRARAIENLSYVAAANRAGSGGGLDFPGHSCVYGPWGEKTSELDDTPGYLVQDVSPARVREVRADYPFLQDMR